MIVSYYKYSLTKDKRILKGFIWPAHKKYAYNVHIDFIVSIK